MNSASFSSIGVVVINLDTRADRWTSFEREVSPFFTEVPVVRLSAIHGESLPGYGLRPWFRGRKRDRTWAGRAGCVLSHRRALELGLQSHWEFVLILEDDVELVADAEKLLPKILGQLNRVQWGVCYLGYTNPIGPARTLGEISELLTVQQVYACSSAHAYLVKSSEIEGLLENLPTEQDVWVWLSRHRAIDAWYSRHLSKSLTVVALSQSIFIQKQSRSDITFRAYEPPHLSRIPNKLLVTEGFSWWFKWSGMKASMSALYDRAKGFMKQHRGF